MGELEYLWLSGFFVGTGLGVMIHVIIINLTWKVKKHETTEKAWNNPEPLGAPSYWQIQQMIDWETRLRNSLKEQCQKSSSSKDVADVNKEKNC